MRTLLLTLLIGLAATNATAAVIHAPQGCRDSLLQNCIDDSNSGDLILLDPGDYDLTAPISFLQKSYVTLRGVAGPFATVICGVDTVADGVRVEYSDHICVEGLTITHCPRYGVQIIQSDSIRIQGNLITHCNSVGVDIPEQTTSRGITLRNNTLTKNWRGIIFEGGSTGSIISNVVWGNDSSQLTCGMPPQLVTCNLVPDNPSCISPCPCDSCTNFCGVQDTIFVDFAGENFRLREPRWGSCGPLGATPVPTDVTSEIRDDAPIRLLCSNPIQTTAAITLILGHPEMIEVDAFTVAGQRVRQLYRGALSVGQHPLSWDTRDDHGQPLPTGLYFLRAKTPRQVAARKVIITK
jgi:parallel beta-helix repeat protein